MSVASKTSQIRFSRQTGLYMPMLSCDAGDLYQEYTGGVDNPQNVVPDFVAMKPTISFVLSSSRVAEGYVVPQSVAWYFNDVLLTFSGGISTNTINGETGHFKEVPYSAGVTNYYGLQIVKNLVKASAGAGAIIKGVAKVRVGNVSDEIQATYPIAISKSVGSQKVVTIAAGDGNFFAIKDKGGNCVLKAVARMGAAEITSCSYKWYKDAVNGWELIAGQTAQTLTVTEEMIDTTGVFKAEVWQGANLIGIDTQTVMDLSDPYDIILNPTPMDETIVQGGGGTVVYRPILVKRGSSVEAKKTTFYFTFYDAGGVVLNPDGAKVASATGTCTEAMCLQANGDVDLVIKSVD